MSIDIFKLLYNAVNVESVRINEGYLLLGAHLSNEDAKLIGFALKFQGMISKDVINIDEAFVVKSGFAYKSGDTWKFSTEYRDTDELATMIVC